MKKLIPALIVIALFSPLTHSAQSKKAPYGCYKNLKWGMSRALTEKSLNAKLKRIRLLKNGYRVKGGIEIEGWKYTAVVFIGNAGLYKIEFDVLDRSYPIENEKRIQVYIERYQELKPVLAKEFGKPKEVLGEDKIADPVFRSSVFNSKAVLLSHWETQESAIVLKVGFIPFGRGQGFEGLQEKYIAFPHSILTYEKKKPGQPASALEY